MSVLHPIAATADAALSAPVGRAAREREAAALAGVAVSFVVEPAGPAFESREAALDAYAGRVEDERPGARAVAPEDRFCLLREMLATRVAGPVQPAFADGRRWPEPAEPPATVWRLSVAYWKIAAAEAAPDLEQARRLRRTAASLDAAALRRLADQRLQPMRPQQPLDLGLFEVRLPENPSIIVPDE
jgi:hypothetical protein